MQIYANNSCMHKLTAQIHKVCLLHLLIVILLTVDGRISLLPRQILKVLPFFNLDKINREGVRAQELSQGF